MNIYKIMVVDDELDIINFISPYLTNENFEVLPFTSADEAMRCLNVEKIDLAILDIMLPGMNGLDFCKEIRKKYSFSIMITIQPYIISSLFQLG